MLGRVGPTRCRKVERGSSQRAGDNHRIFVTNGGFSTFLVTDKPKISVYFTPDLDQIADALSR
jgi:hypothetical protein